MRQPIGSEVHRFGKETATRLVYYPPIFNRTSSNFATPKNDVAYYVVLSVFGVPNSFSCHGSRGAQLNSLSGVPS